MRVLIEGKLRKIGMGLLEKYSTILDQDHKETYIGLLESEKRLNPDTFGNDLNLIIEILTSYEDRMSQEDQEEFDNVCTRSLEI